MAKKICITLDDDLYSKLVKIAHANYGKWKRSVSAYAHLSLVRAINRQSEKSNEPKIRNGKGCVYIIQESGKGYVKIGFAKDFDQRLEGIKTNNPHEIKVISVIEDCIMQDELDLHKKYTEFRVRREWYRGAILNRLYDDIERLKARNNKGVSVPTSSEHYLYLVEA